MNFTIKSQEAVQRAMQVAMEHENQVIEPGHLLKGILDTDENVSPFVFKKIGVNLKIIRQTLDSMIQSYPKVSGAASPYLSRSSSEAFQKANVYLKELNDEYVALEHLLLGILKTNDQVAQMLKDSCLYILRF